MKYSTILSVLLLGSAFLPTLPALEIVKNGKGLPAIVLPSGDLIKAEENAAKELQKFICTVTGVTLPVVKEKSFRGESALYIGKTQFSIRQGITPTPGEREEWILQSVGNSLVITGSRPRGTLYGVYDFLEKYCSVYFPDWDTVHAPRRKNLSIPDNIRIRKKPFFFWRYTVPGSVPRDLSAFRMHLIRNKLNFAYATEDWGGLELYGSPTFAHTYYYYSKDFPKDKKEYFSLWGKERLRAVNGIGPGQICLTHPEVRRLVYEKLCDYIKRDRAKHKDPVKWPRFYAVNQNDNGYYCQCKSCMEYTRKGGNYSDTMIAFMNDLGKRLKKDYPGVKLLPFAYKYTIQAPVFEKPLDNIVPFICNLSTNLTGSSETAKPVTHPLNREFLTQFKKWKALAKELFVWDYWILYNKPHIYPYLLSNRYFEDMKFFAENNVRGMLVENEDPMLSFHSLRQWILYRLLTDPREDREKILSMFFPAVYGPAEKPMRAYFDMLEKACVSEKGSFDLKVPAALPRLNKEFFSRADLLLNKAESLAGKDRKILRKIQQERISVDMARIRMGFVKKEKRKALIDRLERNISTVLATLDPKRGISAKGWKNQLDFLRLDVQLPREFRKTNCVDFTWISMLEARHANIIRVEDPEAVGGKALRIGQHGQKKTHTVPFRAGIYNHLTKTAGPTFTLKQFPRDEKYHLHKICTDYDLKGGTLFWAPWNWRMQVNLDTANAAAPVNLCDIYVSIKFTGPTYVKGSKKEDAVYIDRILVVRK